MYSNRQVCIIKENLIKHLHHHREQFLHEACVRDSKAKTIRSVPVNKLNLRLTILIITTDKRLLLSGENLATSE